MNRVREIRERAKITQASLRRRLGWTQSRLANYEAGSRTPGLEECRALVEALADFGITNESGELVTLNDVFPPRDTEAA